MGFGKNGGESARRVIFVAAIVMFALLFGTAKAVMAEVDQGREIEAEYGVWRDGAALQRVTAIGGELAAAAGKPAETFEYKLLATEELNAMALADGRLYITKGIYEQLNGKVNPLAFVLGHEMTHVVQHHHRKQAKANLAGLIGGAVLGAVLTDKIGGDREDNVRTGAQLGVGIWGGKYSRKDEYRADSGAIDLMVKAEYDPVGAVEAMEAIKARYGRGDAGIPIIGWFASHPDTGDRIKRIRKKIADLTPAAIAEPAGRDPSPRPLRLARDDDQDDTDPHRHSEPPNGGEESRESRRGSFTPPNGEVQDDKESRDAEAPGWENDRDEPARGGARRTERLGLGRPGRPRQRIALSVEDASSQRGSVRYGGGAIFFYGSPAETIPPVLERSVLETGRFVVSPDAPIKAVLAMTHYQMYKGLRGRTNLGSLLGSNVDVRHEQATAVLNAELRIETQEGIVWAVHLDATETGVLNDVEIRGGKWWSARGGVAVEWWKTPAGKATRRVCEQAARELALLDFSNLQELSVFLVAAVRGDKIYVTTDGSLQVSDQLVAAGGPITHPETGEVLGYETGAELEVVDATQPRLAVAKVVSDENGEAGSPPAEGAALFKKTPPRPEREVGRRRY